MASQAHAGAGESISLETVIRVKHAEQLLAKQFTGKQIVRALCKKYEVVERTAYAYIRLAYENLSQASDEERAMRKTLARATWQAQYRRALNVGDLGAANYAFDRLCKIDGVFEAKKVQVEVTGMGYEALSIAAVVGVLDAAGLAAFEIVLGQIEAAKARGEFAEPEPPAKQLPPGIDPDDVIDLDDPKPAPPAKTRNRKQRKS